MATRNKISDTAAEGNAALVAGWLEALGDNPAPEALAEVQRNVRLLNLVGAGGEAAGDEAPEDWPEPKPLPASPPQVAPFDPLLLPSSLRPWLSDVADRIQCPPDFPAVAAMVALGAVVGRKIGIRPQRRNDWQVVPNLWGAVVGRPGIMKTPAVNEALAPLTRLEIEGKRKYEEAEAKFKAEVRAHGIVQGEWEKRKRDEVREALKQNASDAAKLAEGLAKDTKEAGAEPAPPTRRRFLLNDPSVEKVGEILVENPNGVLIFRDELIGFLKGLDREKQDNSRSFYLEAWNGDGRFTYDRIGRGTKDIEAAIVSIFGCIQPGPLRAYLKGATEGLGDDDGLMQRFQLVTWPDVLGEWKNVDRWPDNDARQAGFKAFEQLNQLTPEAAGAERDQFKPEAIPFLRFDPAAQEVFDVWRAAWEVRLRSGKLHPAMESHLSKYRSLAPSLALLHHLAEGHTGPVGEIALETALAWLAYLEDHALRLYGTATGRDTSPARALAERIKLGDVEDGFKLREVYRNQWSGLASKEEAEAAVEVLIRLDWLRDEEVRTGGRPATIYRINPHLNERRMAP